MVKIRIEIFELKKNSPSKRLTPQLKTFVLRKGTVQIGQNALNLFPKDWSSFRSLKSRSKSPNFRNIRGRNILPVINAIKRSSTFNHHNHENGSTIDVYLNILCKHKLSDGIEMASIVVAFCFYSSSFVSLNNYF